MTTDMLGFNIKRLRQTKGFTLRRFAKMLSVSPSFISQIEKGKASPSLQTLKEIADALSTTVGELIGEGHKMPDSPITREEERKSLKDLGKGTSVFLLTTPDHNKQMEPLLVKLAKGGSSGEATYRHYGQEFVLVTKGMMEITLNDVVHVLKKGDSIYFNSKVSHSFRNVSDGETEVLWTITPPSF